MSVTRRCVTYSALPDGSEARFTLIEFAGRNPGKTAVFIAGIRCDGYEGRAALSKARWTGSIGRGCFRAIRRDQSPAGWRMC